MIKCVGALCLPVFPHSLLHSLLFLLGLNPTNHSFQLLCVVTTSAFPFTTIFSKNVLQEVGWTKQYLPPHKHCTWELRISPMLRYWNICDVCWTAFCLCGRLVVIHGITSVSAPSSMAVVTSSGHRGETQWVISTAFPIFTYFIVTFAQKRTNS